MTRLSIETAFSWGQRFVAREWGLLLPIALAFIALPPLALGLLVPADLQQVLMTPPVKDLTQVTAVMTRLLPLMLVMLAIGGVGGLAITALALTPGMSVAEAIIHGAKRLPTLAISVLILFVGLVLFTVIETTIFMAVGLDQRRVQSVVLVMMIVAMVFLLVRMTPLLGVIVDRRIGAIDAIRETWVMGRGVGWKMALALFVYNAGSIIVVLALGTALGACILAVTRLGGWPDVAPPLLAVVDRVLAAVAVGGSYLLGASFYRQLSRNKGI